MTPTVTLIDFTGSGFPNPARRAAEILAFTKATRLTMNPQLMAEIAAWPDEKMNEELAYMANTIPSSWEFVDYTFLVSNVTRAYTHQQVRTRTASFAQQTMRVLDVSDGPGWHYAVGPSIESDMIRRTTYDNAMEVISDTYKSLIADGAEIEDARGVLPTNILTNIVVKMNMRTFVEMVRKRSSPRTQGEYRAVLDGMAKEVAHIHPWISLFVDRTFDRAAKDLDKAIAKLKIPKEQKAAMIKLVDQMRGQS